MKGQAVSVKIQDAGLAELRTKLSRFSDKMKKKIAGDAMLAGAKVHLAAAKLLVPVDTGQLKRSLATKKNSSREEVGAMVLARRSGSFTGGYYSHLVERGHVIFRTVKGGRRVRVGFYGGQPFMRPGMEQNVDKILKAIKERADQGIKETKL